MEPKDFDPVMTSIGLLQAKADAAMDAYVEWQRPILARYGMGLETLAIDEGLDALTKSLLPLTAPIATRFAFVSTTSSWSAYFDNNRTGTDSATTMPVLAARLGCDAARVVMIPAPVASSISSRFRYRATILECYGPDGLTRRSIYAANDGGRWKSGQSGEPYPFEEVAAYSAKEVSSRFNRGMLERYLLHLGARPFDRNWYVEPALMVQKTGKLPLGLSEHLG